MTKQTKKNNSATGKYSPKAFRNQNHYEEMITNEFNLLLLFDL